MPRALDKGAGTYRQMAQWVLRTIASCTLFFCRLDVPEYDAAPVRLPAAEEIKFPDSKP